MISTLTVLDWFVFLLFGAGCVFYGYCIGIRDERRRTHERERNQRKFLERRARNEEILAESHRRINEPWPAKANQSGPHKPISYRSTFW